MNKYDEIKIGLECCEKFLNGAPEEECCHVCNYANNCAELKMDAINLIGKLEAQVPKWISVEEREPEAKMAVLAFGQRVVFNGKRIEQFPMEHVAYTRGPDEGWFSWDSGDVIEVTHWMPLPEPPNEEPGADYISTCEQM